MSFVIITVICVAIAYPFCGAILYADPWTWIFKEDTK